MCKIKSTVMFIFHIHLKFSARHELVQLLGLPLIQFPVKMFAVVQQKH